MNNFDLKDIWIALSIEDEALNNLRYNIVNKVKGHSFSTKEDEAFYFKQLITLDIVKRRLKENESFMKNFNYFLTIDRLLQIEHKQHNTEELEKNINMITVYLEGSEINWKDNVFNKRDCPGCKKFFIWIYEFIKTTGILKERGIKVIHNVDSKYNYFVFINSRDDSNIFREEYKK